MRFNSCYHQYSPCTKPIRATLKNSFDICTDCYNESLTHGYAIQCLPILNIKTIVLNCNCKLDCESKSSSPKLITNPFSILIKT